MGLLTAEEMIYICIDWPHTPGCKSIQIGLHRGCLDFVIRGNFITGIS